MILTPEPLTVDAFAPFGSVVECGAGDVLMINDGTCERHHALALIEHSEGRRAAVSIFRAQPRTMPMRIAMMERHPLGSQAFMPMLHVEGDGDWLVVVADDDGGRPAPPRAFRARADQGVSYGTNVWHHPLIALGGVRLFTVIDAIGDEPNLEERDYAEPYVLESA